MRTPTRKPGKYSNLIPDPNMTEIKFKKFQSELKKIKQKRPYLIDEVKTLALMGDFSENAAYQIAKGQLRGLNQRKLDIEKMLTRANIIKPQKNCSSIQLGSIVTIEINNKTREYQILGSSETNPELGVISNNSPLGASLMGHQTGDTVKIKKSDTIVEYKIIKIE